VVAVEALGSPVVWSALQSSGATLFPVPLDEHGMRIEELERLLGERPVRAVYLTPHHQFPTTAVMPVDRRRALLALAARHRVAVIEDDYDHEFHYDERPIPPLASVDSGGVVIYVGTLSKILAPGLRLGFVVAPAEVIARLAGVRAVFDLQGDQTMECAVADLFEEGEVQRHVHRMRGLYARRRDALAEALRRELGGAIAAAPPPGGMAIWARVRGDIDVDAWAARGLSAGVAFRSGRVYDLDGSAGGASWLRLAFTLHDEGELALAARRMAAALNAGARGGST
jgi:GntR family transcriptional regulator/MocR family aminotransferase